ncbi:MAG TPA: prepilin peptidase [Gemmatimonadaceae bacterium]
MLRGLPGGVIAGVAFTTLLLVIARWDVRARRIPNGLVLALAATGLLAAATVLRREVGLGPALGGMATGFAIWLPLWLLRVIGAGDVKLAAAIGAWVGWPGILQATVLGVLAGGVLAVGMLARRGAMGRLATDVALWFGAWRIGGASAAVAARPTPASHRREVLPYGVALATGALLVAWLPAPWLQWLAW